MIEKEFYDASVVCSSKWTGRDGTPLFDIEYQNPARPGNSGSPVLNERDEVVGLWAWYFNDIPTKGIAESSVVLANPC